MELYTVKNILEAILLSVDKPLDLRQLDKLFEADDENRPSKEQIVEALQALQADYQGRGMELTEVSSGYRIQVREDYTGWISRLWEEKVPRYSRALLETLVLIAYRQPITRGEIEEIRGVSVSSHIMKTLQEREWVRVLGHKDVPGKPSMYGTTSDFLDYFNLKSLDELPPLSDIKDLDQLHPSLQLDDELAKKEGEQAASELNTETSAEVDAESANSNEQADAPDDSYQAGVEEADEDLDEKLEQEALAVARQASRTHGRDKMADESSEPQHNRQADEPSASAEPSDVDDRDQALEQDVNASDLDQREQLTQQDDPPPAEPTQADVPEAMADEAVTLESERDDTEQLLKDVVNSDEADEEEVAVGDTSEPGRPVSFEQSAEDDRDEVLEQDDPPPAEPAQAVEPEVLAVEAPEPESERDQVEEPLDDRLDADEAGVEDVDVEESPEQEKQVLSYEPSETAGVDESERESPEQDIPPEPQRGGWTKLAQMLWERLKKLMQKGRKRQAHDWRPGPALLNC